MLQPLFLETGTPSRLPDLWPVVVPCALGLLAIFWLLPRARPYPPLWGASVGGLALLTAGWLLVRSGAAAAETVLFYAFAGIAVLAGGLLVTQRNPARAALSFALVVLSTCGLFLLLAAPFLMAATTIIYAGAIVVTFLFVIMLAQQEGRSDADQRSREPLLSCIAGFVLLGALLYLINTGYGATPDLDRLRALSQRTADLKGRLEGLEAQIANEAAYHDTLQATADEVFSDNQGRKSLLAEYEEWAKDLLNDPADLRRRTHHGAEDVERLLDLVVNAKLPVVRIHQQLRDGKKGIDLRDLENNLQMIQAAAQRFENTQSFLPPAEKAPLSEFSGPAPNRWGPDLRRDSLGRPAMPAENTALLGRSLFTDYLIPVELAGTLLLVATIGAIAIAHRRAEGER